MHCANTLFKELPKAATRRKSGDRCTSLGLGRVRAWQGVEAMVKVPFTNVRQMVVGSVR